MISLRFEQNTAGIHAWLDSLHLRRLEMDEKKTDLLQTLTAAFDAKDQEIAKCLDHGPRWLEKADRLVPDTPLT